MTKVTPFLKWCDSQTNTAQQPESNSEISQDFYFDYQTLWRVFITHVILFNIPFLNNLRETSLKSWGGKKIK